MSLDRFLAVSYPLQTKHLRTPRAALGVALAIWTLAVATSVPPTVAFTVRNYNYTAVDDFSVCAEDWETTAWAHKATYYLVLVITMYFLPVALIGVFSILTVRQLWSMEATDGPSQRR